MLIALMSAALAASLPGAPTSPTLPSRDAPAAGTAAELESPGPALKAQLERTWEACAGQALTMDAEDPAQLEALRGALRAALDEAKRRVSVSLDEEVLALQEALNDPEAGGAQASEALSRWELTRDCALGRAPSASCAVPLSEDGSWATQAYREQVAQAGGVEAASRALPRLSDLKVLACLM